MLKRGNWSVEELIKLRSQYGRRPIAHLARDLKRTEETVEQRALQMFTEHWARELGIEDPAEMDSFEGREGPLTPSECEELRLMLGVADLETMQLVLGREVQEIEKVLVEWARKLDQQPRKGRFSGWELEYLKHAYGTRPDWALTLVLGRDVHAMRRKANELCLGKHRGVEPIELPVLEKHVVIEAQAPLRMPRWTPEEVEHLRALFADRANLDIAKELGRSVKSVVAKANELGLKKTASRLRAMGRENVRIRHKKSQARKKKGAEGTGSAE